MNRVVLRYLHLAITASLAISFTGCGSLSLRSPKPKTAPLSELVGVNRRTQRATAMASPSPESHTPTGPTSRPADPTSQPAALAALTKPYRLDMDNIVKLMFHLSPLVTAEREDMVASQYALDEFKYNLSRFEPFVETTGTTFQFPQRSDSEGWTGEATGGIEKETFEGAIIRLEGGASASRVEFGDVANEEDAIEDGGGALIRGRIEIPFVGSRRRQNRVISQAFQESNARRAKLNYITRYGTYVTNALTHYQNALLYKRYARAYADQIKELESLGADNRVPAEDKARIDSMWTSSEVLRNQYDTLYRDRSLILTSLVGLEPLEEYDIIEPPYDETRYLALASTTEGEEQMLAEALANNPRFQVLQDAIADTELQREQAILGEYDVTAFVQGTQFPFGSPTFDNRVDGWEITTGVTVRLNDKRVLTATRLKADAEIRQFKAEIESERLRIMRQIATETDTLRAYHATHVQIVELLRQKQADYESRKKAYLEQQENDGGQDLLIDDVLDPLGELTSARIRLAANSNSIGGAEVSLLGATGEVYRIVGMKIDDDEDVEE